MVDIQRDTATLLALLPDNVTGDITPQDARDVLVSVLGGFGAFSLKDGVTPQTFGTTPAKFTGWTTVAASGGVTASLASKELIPTVGAWYLVFAPLTVSGPPGRSFEARINLNDVETSIGHRGTFPSAGKLSLPLMGLVFVVANGDRLSVYGESDLAGTDIVGVDGFFAAKRIG